MGRPQKPLALKLRDGTYRPGVDPDPSAQMRLKGAVKPPINLDETARELWKSVIEPLISAGVVMKSDEVLAGMMCETYSLYYKSRVAAFANPIDKDSRISYLSYYQAFEKTASKFGLSPADRERVTGIASKKKEFEELDRIYG